MAVKKNCPQSNTNYFVIVITIAVDFPIPIKQLLKHYSYHYTYCLISSVSYKKKLVPTLRKLQHYFFLRSHLVFCCLIEQRCFLKTFLSILGQCTLILIADIYLTNTKEWRWVQLCGWQLFHLRYAFSWFCVYCSC